MKDKFFQIFFCIYIFWGTALVALFSLRGLEVDGRVLRLALVLISGISWLFYFLYPTKSRYERLMIFFLILFGISYYCTHFFYEDQQNYDLYIGQLLRWGADCVSGCLIGMTLMKLSSYDLIHKILPLECIALTPFMASATLTMAKLEGQMYIDAGMSYQTVAYMMAVLFCISFFYTFIHKRNHAFVFKLILIFVMLFQAVCCAMSGGRGGLVLLVVYVIYMCYFLYSRKILSASKIAVALIFGLIGFSIIATEVGMWTSAGYLRSSAGVRDTDRIEMWKSIWHFVTDNHFIGYGLGGDYYTFGFYTHNLILDLLIETGLLGTIVMLFILAKTYSKISRMSNVDNIFIVLLILFIYGIVMNMFSGYWICMNLLWLSFGVAITYRTYFARVR